MTNYNKIPQKVSNVNQQAPQVETRTRPAPITTAKPMKRSLFSRLGNAMFGEGGVKSVFRYIGQEVVVPALQHIVVDGVNSGINMLVYGENKPPMKPQSYQARPYYGGGYTNYSNRYIGAQQHVQQGPQYISNVRASNRVADYIIEDRNSALDVLARLTEQATAYDVASVADYYDMIGVETSYTDYDYGWPADVLTHTTIKPSNGGWFIDLPQVMNIKRG